jgi:hypothetical protein
MSTPAAVRRLNHDIRRLNSAEKTRDRALDHVQKDRKELEQDRRHIEHVRDVQIGAIGGHSDHVHVAF